MGFLDRFSKKEASKAPVRPQPKPIEMPEIHVPEPCMSKEKILDLYAPKQTLYSDSLSIYPHPEENHGLLYRGWVKNASDSSDFVFESVVLDSRFLLEKRTALLPGKNVNVDMKLNDVKPDILAALDRSREVQVTVTFRDKFGRVITRVSGPVALPAEKETEASETEQIQSPDEQQESGESPVPEAPSETIPDSETESQSLQETKPSTSADSAVPTNKQISAEVKLISPIDVFEASEGDVLIGTITVCNREPKSNIVSFNVEYDGETVYLDRTELDSETAAEISIYIPRTKLCQDSTRNVTVRVNVNDEDGMTVCMYTTSIKVRSRFDINMGKLNLRMSQLVNPNSTAITDFVERADGPLLKEGKLDRVTGYQNADYVLEQVEAVYNAVRSLDMHYVSDVWTQKGDDGFFQRIRDPETVLEDRSGNCIEFSVLFCSILEAMDLEPVMAFPKNHAVPGVVLETDMYSTKCKNGVKHPKAVRYESDGKYVDVLFFEATLVEHERCSFDHAVNVAYETLSEEHARIESEQDYVLISKLRREDLNPEV